MKLLDIWSLALRYLDSETRLEQQALGYWIDKEPAASASHLRLQTGYFSINGLSGFGKIIQALVDADRPISTVIGSNDKDTTKGDIESLIDLIGCPRTKARACIVSYSGGLFHPKVIHLTRTDGSQLAYVGSANLTTAGVAAGNVEAGLLLDSNDGDPVPILTEIAARIDSWFNTARPEASRVSSREDVQKLTDVGILGVVKPNRPSQVGCVGTSVTGSKPSLKPLIRFTPLATSPTTTNATGGSPSPVPSTPATTVATVALLATGNEILIAEIGAGKRWKQANFPIAMMQNYFGVNPIANDHIKLHEVESGGAVGNVVDTKVVNVKSQNYRIELTAVSGIPYPTTGRPIGVFKKIASKEFRYRVFLPSDPNHSVLESYLVAKYVGPSRQLKRVIIDSSELQKLWSSCPV